LANQVSRLAVGSTNLKSTLRGIAQIILSRTRTEYVSIYIKPASDQVWQHFSVGSGLPRIHNEKLSQINKLINQLNSAVVVVDEMSEQSEIYQQLRQHNVVAVVRLGLRSDDKNRAGFMLLGDIQTTLFSDEEVKALGAIGNTIAMTINSSNYYEQIQQFNEELKDRVKKATLALRHSNQKLQKLDQA
jgi:transcriptional regulator with GAF, ATPase, and Fis domain